MIVLVLTKLEAEMLKVQQHKQIIKLAKELDRYVKQQGQKADEDYISAIHEAIELTTDVYQKVYSAINTPMTSIGEGDKG